MNRSSMRNLLLIISVALWLVSVVVGPVAAQDDEDGDEATPVPTSMPPVSPPVLAPSPSPEAIAAAPGQPAPPSVTGGVFSDPLTSGRVLPAGVCRTGYALGDLLPEGLELTVLGYCFEGQEQPSLTVPARGVTIGDGDVALDLKVTNNPGRVGVNVFVRDRDGKLMSTYLSFARNEATLFKREGGQKTTVASRQDLNQTIDPGAWNRVALRVKGGEAWLLINDTPYLYTADVIDQVGGIGIALVREGNTEDEDEAVVVFKDLTLSTVQGADPARAPTYKAP